eukprot:sb/3472925/
MIFGLPEESAGIAVDATVTSLLEELDEKPLLASCIRLGTNVESKVRPVKVTLQSKDSLLVILRKACELRKSRSYSRVYIEPDMSFAERAERRKSIKTLNELRHEHPERKYILRKGVITDRVHLELIKSCPTSLWRSTSCFQCHYFRLSSIDIFARGGIQ